MTYTESKLAEQTLPCAVPWRKNASRSSYFHVAMPRRRRTLPGQPFFPMPPRCHHSPYGQTLRGMLHPPTHRKPLR